MFQFRKQRLTPKLHIIHDMPKIDHEIDTTGFFCPEPLMIVRNKVRDMKAGERLLIIASDPSTHRDFTNFCRFMGHTLELAEVNDSVHKFVIRKG